MMIDPDGDRPRRDPAFARWLAITLVRVAASVGAVFGVVLIARAQEIVPRLLGAAIVLSGLWVMASVSRAFVRRWRSPE